jgi:hypothetical protein
VKPKRPKQRKSNPDLQHFATELRREFEEVEGFTASVLTKGSLLVTIQHARGSDRLVVEHVLRLGPGRGDLLSVTHSRHTMVDPERNDLEAITNLIGVVLAQVTEGEES